MERVLFGLVAIFLFSGCATNKNQASASHPPNPELVKTPVCETRYQCEQAWAAAQEMLPILSNMRATIVTDSRIETYSPIQDTKYGMIVMKAPVTPTSYAIKYQILCRRQCYKGVEESSTNLFNAHVNNAIKLAKFDEDHPKRPIN